MPSGTDPRWSPASPDFLDEEPDPNWRRAPESEWSNTPDVESLIAAHRGPVIPPPSRPRSQKNQWWLAVVAVIIVGGGVIAAIILAPKLYHGTDNHIAQPAQTGPSSAHNSAGPSASASPSAGASPGAVTLHPNANGVVDIATKSGKTRCAVSTDSVTCYAEFTNSPLISGHRANEVSVTTSGDSPRWNLSNAGAPPDKATLDYQTYEAQGWTIVATIDGTRFTNDNTKHGMFTSIDNVQSF